MHDKPDDETQSMTDLTDAPATAVGSLINDLAAADPADAPDIADAVAGHLEAGLASEEVPGSAPGS